MSKGLEWTHKVRKSLFRVTRNINDVVGISDNIRFFFSSCLKSLKIAKQYGWGNMYAC